MSAPRNPPFRAEHLGSLLRPEQLLKKRAAFENKQCSASELQQEEDAAVKEIVQLQLDAGFHAVSDGGYRYEPPFPLQRIYMLPSKPNPSPAAASSGAPFSKSSPA